MIPDPAPFQPQDPDNLNAASALEAGIQAIPDRPEEITLSHSIFTKGIALTAFAAATLPMAATSIKGEAHAVVVTPISIKPQKSLHFGTIIKDKNEEGTVHVQHHGAFDHKGVKPGLTKPNAAHFEVSAPKDTAYSITIEKEVDITKPSAPKGGSGTMVPRKMKVKLEQVAVDGKMLALDASTHTSGSLVLKGGTPAKIEVGAILEVNKDATGGKYTGTYQLDINHL